MRFDLFPGRDDWRELARPWKLVSFALGMAWLLYGATHYAIADWDVGISVLMGGLTYAFAPWSVTTLAIALRNRGPRWVLRIVVALAIAWFVIDGVYVAYHAMVGNQTFRAENFAASCPLYFLAGVGWMYRGSLRQLIADLRAAVRLR